MQHTQSKAVHADPLLLREIRGFYFPMALSAVFMMFSHNVVNSALSRTAHAETSIAAYAVALGLANLIASPCFACLQMFLTFGKDKVSFNNGIRFSIKIAFTAFVLIGLLAFTPLGDFISLNIFNTPSSLYPDVQKVLKIALVMPFVFTWNAISRSLILVEKKTKVMTLARALRVSAMIVMAVVLPQLQAIQGAAVGFVIFMTGMSIESLCNTIFGLPGFLKWKDLPENQRQTSLPPTQRAVFQFLWPLMITSIVWALTKPLLYAGLGLLPNPEQAIAIYQVASFFVWIFVSLVEENVRQLVTIYGHDKHYLPVVRCFLNWLSFGVMGIIIFVTLTPISKYFLLNVLGISKNLVDRSMLTMLFLSIMPIVMAWQEYYMSLFLLKGLTRILGTAKICNIIGTTGVVFLLAWCLPKLGAAAGSLAMIAGYAVELLVLVWVYQKNSAFLG